jgi:hypothetical protein
MVAKKIVNVAKKPTATGKTKKTSAQKLVADLNQSTINFKPSGRRNILAQMKE